MNDHRPSPADPPDPAPTADLDLGQLVSVHNVPADWLDAEGSAPNAGKPSMAPRPGNRSGGRSSVPIRHESTFIANAVAAATGFISASAWYLADILDLYGGPWAPVVAALFIATAVRVFSKANPTHRGVVSVLTYLLVLLIVLMLLTHRDLIAVYGTIDDYRAYEQSLVRSRLQDPLHLAAYGIGVILAAVIPLAGERR